MGSIECCFCGETSNLAYSPRPLLPADDSAYCCYACWAEIVWPRTDLVLDEFDFKPEFN